MPSPKEISQLASRLHQDKLINLDASAAQFINNSGFADTDPGLLAGWYVVGGDHYVVVCGLTAPGDMVIH